MATNYSRNSKQEEKTGLMIVSAAHGFEPRVSISFGGHRIDMQKNMKILGMTIDTCEQSW